MKYKLKSNERKKIVIQYLLFLALYMFLFAVLEQRKTPISLVMSRIDQHIPFCEYFIIPYFFWFVYLGFTAVYFGLFCRNIKEIKKASYSFITGMSVFLFVSLFFPNGHMLRPNLVEEGLFVSAVKFLYSIDTSTNVFPSMHVFCTIAASIALLRQKELRNIKGFKVAIHVISILIILSTMLLKQHSIIDVVGAFILNGVCYYLFYKEHLLLK